MRTAALIFPNQLFSSHPALSKEVDLVIVIEHSLFFGDSQYPCQFHLQKIAYHKATIVEFVRSLKHPKVELVQYTGTQCQIEATVAQLKEDQFSELHICDPVDYALAQRLKSACDRYNLAATFVKSPGFINSTEENQRWRQDRKRWHMADFYQWQRKKLDILMEDGKPLGGKWSYDDQNRKKIPNKAIGSIPELNLPSDSKHQSTFLADITKNFSANPGELQQIYYPTTRRAASTWLDDFLAHRFENFGHYEDAMVQGHSWLYHSVLTPMMNVGLLEPTEVVNRALEAADEYQVPLNSVEGFVRQIIGWREFMRATYEDIGVEMRRGNHWHQNRDMPESFYTGETGITPFDDTIKRVLKTGYCHHIERLMVLGGFMFLCEINPKQIYQWFMEMFVDSYDWVMVPNVYSMSQHADGGLITTKPYFSGSNYVLKMSNYKKGPWCEIWDALFWRWIIVHQTELSGNHRWSMICKQVEKMDRAKRGQYVEKAESYLNSLSKLH